ncbi:MAG: histidine phosphatase family protein [Acidimicrobiaceae bacterium]|nr:histidine phosphatase family protein [Acidimicrobiaceae bacterium]
MKLVFIRHAKAGSSGHFAGEDFYRPLTKPGGRQALAIADLAELKGTDSIVSSPYLRCIQTVEPLSKRLGIPLNTDPILGDATAVGDLEIWLSKAMSDLPQFKVVCSHGDVIPVLVRLLFEMLPGIEYPALCSKGSQWYFDIRAGAISAARYLELDGYIWDAVL